MLSRRPAVGHRVMTKKPSTTKRPFSQAAHLEARDCPSLPHYRWTARYFAGGGNSMNDFAPLSQADRASAATSAPLPSSPHSHTTATLQPSSKSLRIVRRSRSTVPENFVCQNAVFDAGLVAKRHPSCRCQKQPWTWIAARYRGKTISGRPGKLATCNRYRKPFRCSARRSVSSGWVFRPRIPDIIRDRVSLFTISAIQPLPWRLSSSWSIYRLPEAFEKS